jgi:hypothetical protein
MRNSIEFAIPLALGNGSTVQTLQCKLTADYFEGYAKDEIKKGETILLDFVIGSAGTMTDSIRREYAITHAHPETCEGQPCTWFMAVPRSVQC